MRYPASEKLEIIRTVEGAHLSRCPAGDACIAERGADIPWTC